LQALLGGDGCLVGGGRGLLQGRGAGRVEHRRGGRAVARIVGQAARYQLVELAEVVGVVAPRPELGGVLVCLARRVVGAFAGPVATGGTPGSGTPPGVLGSANEGVAISAPSMPSAIVTHVRQRLSIPIPFLPPFWSTSKG